jgi:WD40 repeat protein
VATGQLARRVVTDRGPVIGLALAPDGKMMAVRDVVDRRAGQGAKGGSYTLTVWDTTTGRMVRRLAGPSGDDVHPTYSPDGQYMAGRTRHGEVWLWEADSGRCIAQHRGLWDGGPGVCFTTGGRAVAYGSAGSSVHLWDLRAAEPLCPTEGHREPVVAVAFGPGGRSLVSADDTGLLCSWDPVTGRETGRLWIGDAARDRGLFQALRREHVLALSGDGRRVLSGVRWSLRLWDAATGREAHALDTGEENATFDRAAFSPDGSLLAAAVRDEEAPNPTRLCVYDVRNGRCIRRLDKAESLVNALALSPDNGALAAVIKTEQAGRLCLWDLTTGKQRWQAKRPDNSPCHLAFAPGSMTLALAEGRAAVTLWDIAIGRQRGGFADERSGNVLAVRFSPDGRTLAVADAQERTVSLRVRVWEVSSGTVRQKFAGHRGEAAQAAWFTEVATLEFSPDGRSLATGGADTTVLLWDLTGRSNVGPRHGNLTAAEREGLWAALDAADARTAFAAMCRLRARPEEAVPLLKGHVKPVVSRKADAPTVARLVADLDSDSFERREEATGELEALGESIRGMLQKALAGSPSPEVKRRLEVLLGRREAQPPARELWRPLRALEVLEGIATPEARGVLKALAEGAPDARLTQEASETLRRLGRRPVQP